MILIETTPPAHDDLFDLDFTNWLLGQTLRRDPVGDLARDAQVDPVWPEGARDFDAFVLYLKVSPTKVAGLYRAWMEWLSTTCGGDRVAMRRVWSVFLGRENEIADQYEYGDGLPTKPTPRGEGS